MSEKQFDIFDDSFRKAADQFEPEFNEAAWQKMEALLDKNQKSRKPFYWLRWFTDGIMISLMVVMAYPVFTKHAVKQQDVHKVQAVSKPAINDIGKSDKNNNNAVITKKIFDEQATKQVAINDPVVIRKTNTGSAGNGKTIGKKQVGDGIALHNDYAVSKQRTGMVTVVNSKSRTSNKYHHPPGLSPVIAADTKTKTGTEINPGTYSSGNASGKLNERSETTGAGEMGKKEADVNTATDALITAKTQSTNTQSLQPKTFDSASNNTATKDLAAPLILKTTDLSYKGFYLHASVSPEYSFVSNNGAGPLTAAFGGGVGYSFGKRFSVQAGLFSTYKNYDAGPGDYQTKKGGYWDSVSLLNVNAKCNVLEIPVTVSYSLLNSGQHHLVVSAGFASLVMSQEHYEYDIRRGNGPEYYVERTYQTKKFEPFAAMMLSAGYMYSINKKISLVALPYLKIPLYGVGEGSVKISSAGMLLGLQYGILETGKRKQAAQN